MNSVKSTLLRYYARVLRPLIRILIRNGASYAEIQETVKKAIVETAIRDFLNGPDCTVERVANLVGLDEEVVRETVKSALTERPMIGEAVADAIGRVLDAWHREEGYSGMYGLPLDLGEHELKSLCEKFARGFSDNAIIGELVRSGCIVKSSDTQEVSYRCVKRTHLSEQLSVNQIERLANQISNLVATLDTNLHKAEQGAGRFERTVWPSTGLGADQLQEFDKLIREKADDWLVSVDNWLAVQPEPTSEEAIRTGLSIFHYVEDEGLKTTFAEVLKEKKFELD